MKDLTNIDENGDYVWEDVSFEEFRGTILKELGKDASLKPFANISDVSNCEALIEALKTSGNDVICSNLELVTHLMNNIRGVIKNIAIASANSFSSTAPAFLGTCINSYGYNVSTFMESLLSETESVVSHAEGIAAMDAKFENDITDYLLRNISDKYNNTNLVGEIDSTIDEEPSDKPTEAKEIDYSNIDSSQLSPELLDSIVLDLKYPDKDDLSTKRDDTEVLLDFLDKSGYTKAKTRVVIKNILTSQACADYCKSKGYSDTEDVYSQIEFLIKESDALSKLKNLNVDGMTLHDGMRQITLSFNESVFEGSKNDGYELWKNIYDECMKDLRR